jgi:hypothetical protein
MEKETENVNEGVVEEKAKFWATASLDNWKWLLHETAKFINECSLLILVKFWK